MEKSQKTIVKNPSKNYETIGEMPISTYAEIDEKIKLARKSHLSWSTLDIKSRIAFLENLYQAFLKQQHELAQIIAREMGMPITVCKTIDIQLGLQYMRGYLDNAPSWLASEIVFENKEEIHYTTFESHGVAGVSIPWNYPFCNFIWGVIQNLVVGNTVVIKHSEQCSLTSKLLEETIQSTNLPDGVFNQIYGNGSDIGEYLMNSDIDLIYFTGSTQVGKHLYQIAAKKFIPAMLELGGSAAGIVFDDVDLPSTIELIYLYRFINSGQTCDGLKRLIVQRSCFDQVVNGLKKVIATKKIGDAEDGATDLGPLVNERQLTALEEQVADAVKKGATVITGGKRPTGLRGAYYEPTILTNISFDMRVWKEEVFGLVLPIVPFDTEQEAIALANDCEYGLGGYVYTRDAQRALRVCNQMQTGNISVNGANYVIAQDPFGGYKYSGLGREHGKQGLREFCLTKLIALKK